jgi:hypothetical protein
MTVPTSMNMKFKFPKFRNLDDGEIEFAIEEAVVACGTISGDYGGWLDDANLTLATMYYAAHLLQVAIMRAQSGTGQIKASESTPEFSVSYVTPVQASLDRPIDFTLTIYGVRFLQLCRKNFPPVLVANSAVRMF